MSTAEDLEERLEGIGEGNGKDFWEEKLRTSHEEGDKNIFGEGHGLTSELDTDSIVGIT